MDNDYVVICHRDESKNIKLTRVRGKVTASFKEDKAFISAETAYSLRIEVKKVLASKKIDRSQIRFRYVHCHGSMMERAAKSIKGRLTNNLKSYELYIEDGGLFAL